MWKVFLYHHIQVELQTDQRSSLLAHPVDMLQFKRQLKYISVWNQTPWCIAVLAP